MMKIAVYAVALILMTVSDARILRNNALMTKMVSKFRNDNELSEEYEKPNALIERMQNVLCKNFPTIPCHIISKDHVLRKLIERSVQQLNQKKVIKEQTTPLPYLTLFPVMQDRNSEDLSNFIETRNSREDFQQQKPMPPPHKKVIMKEKKKNYIGKMKKAKHTSVYNSKNIRKFYPHKVKYKDKSVGRAKEEFGGQSEERLSMSVEPDTTLTKNHQHFSYKMEPEDPPVWRIDYMKHGEPKLDMFGFNRNGYENVMKTGPNVVIDENLRRDSGRRGVMHPDVFINKNYVRKNMISTDLNSDGVD